jgi:hypothetical protein
MKKKVTLSVDSDIYGDFQKYCEENAIMLSKKIELFMKDFLENEGDSNQTFKKSVKTETFSQTPERLKTRRGKND